MPSHSITVSHDVPYQLLLSGTHGVSAGSVMIFVPSTSTDCTGASGLVASTIPDYGGTVALDANTNQPSVTIRLHGSQPDGTPAGTYALCLAEPPKYNGHGEALTDASFDFHGHVTVVVVHEPPSAVFTASANIRVYVAQGKRKQYRLQRRVRFGGKAMQRTDGTELQLVRQR